MTLNKRSLANIDVVFHQAAIRITQCAEEPRLALEVLVDGTFNLLEAARAAGAGGRGLGRLFVYKQDRTSNPSHSVVARVTLGMDMVKLAGPGQRCRGPGGGVVSPDDGIITRNNKTRQVIQPVGSNILST